ncbi:hypothetical protein M513_12061 [Trichuris suis]|uniref:Helix-turn-helix domain-containing protein n=1 Tax=Trichuris suis TaxID=68888 RepID=A0A085LQ27_9BILA|nr:hypothetical protein M513_12061 [Trichuris suis]
MVDRAHRLCDPQFLPAELGHIKRTFLYNGFPGKLVNSCITRRMRHLHGETAAREPTQDIRITVPYYQGLSEKIQTISRDLGFTVSFSRSANLGSMLRSDKLKAPPDQRPGAVYQITCTCGALYIGETGNSVSHRFTEHLRSLTRYRNAEARHMGLDVRTRGRPQTLEPTSAMQKALDSSAVTEHAVACQKTATDLSISVLHRELQYKRREIIEALYIRHNRTINKDAGHTVSEAWVPLTAAHMCLHANPTEKHHLTAASIADRLSPDDYTREPTGHPQFP